jgi:hypothetical protein
MTFQRTALTHVRVCVAGLTADVTTVAALARLTLLAQRRDARIRFLGASAELMELIELCGLSVCLLADGSGIEPGRQAEQREESLCVEECVDSLHAPP